MRFNDKELASLSLENADFEGRLNYRKIPSGNFSQGGSGFKERWFKLKNNLLFYFKIIEGKIDDKPAGVMVLETAKVQMQLSGPQFAFSLTFSDDPDKRHIFAARSETQVHSWVNTLKSCTYESQRNQLVLLQSKINRITGMDPLLMYPRNRGVIRNNSVHQQTSAFVKTTFQSHVKYSEPHQSFPTQPHRPTPETNLIDL